MAYYHNQIKLLKSQDQAKIIKTIFNKKRVELNVIDDSIETSKLLFKWRKKYWNWFDTKFDGSPEQTKKWISKKIFPNNPKIFFIKTFL